MPRSPSTYSLPPGTTPQVPNTVISSSMFTAFADDVAQTFNTVQPIVYGGTGSNDLKLTDTDFGIKDNGDPTKIGQFNASNIPTATTRTYDLPYYSGTLGLVSDIRGQIFGLTLSNNVTDPTNDIDIAAGSVVDTTGTASMLLASSLTKRLDAAWAVGSGNGWLDTGSIGNNVYHVFLIRRPDTGVVDSLASLSPTAPVLPANYTQFRRIGTILRRSGTILGFVQNGNYFAWKTSIVEVSLTTVSTTAVVAGLNVPTGFRVMADIEVSLFLSTNGDQVLITSPDANDEVPGTTNMTVGGGVANQIDNNRFSILTDATGQIRRRGANGATVAAFTIRNFGYYDNRDQY